MVTPAGASLGLVPFVKTYYREMLQQHVRLKQQLIVQLQNQKAKQRKKKNAKGKKWKSVQQARAANTFLYFSVGEMKIVKG